MALQDVCRFQDILLDRMAMEDTQMFFGKKTRCDPDSGLPRSNIRNLFHFYVPVAEYLVESPIQFGQISPCLIQKSIMISTEDSILSTLSLLSGLPPSSSSSVHLPFPISHGTTTLAFMFQGGVIAAADTRSSCSGLVACPAAQKILPVHSHLVATTSGTSADCALWKRILARELRLYQLRHGRQLSTGGAAKLLSHMLHPFKGTELCVATTLCGWDGGEVNVDTETGLECLPGTDAESKKNQTTDLKNTASGGQAKDTLPVMRGKTQCPPSTIGEHQSFSNGSRGLSGPSLYYVCSDGTRLPGKLFSVGSGSPYAYSVLDGEVRWGLTVEEATSVAREAVYRATHRDAYSGNCVDVYHITSKGWTRRNREDLKEEYYREKEREREKLKERMQ